MQMTFTTSFKGVPILFDQWAPQTTAAFALSWFAIFLSAIGMRGLIFIRAYLSTEHWGKVVRHWMLLKTRSKPARQVVRYGLKHSGQFSHSSWRSFPTLWCWLRWLMSLYDPFETTYRLLKGLLFRNLCRSGGWWVAAWSEISSCEWNCWSLRSRKCSMIYHRNPSCSFAFKS